MSQKAILVDIDGVLRNGDDLIDGALEFLSHLQGNNLPCCLLSNSTKLTADSVRTFFAAKGFDLSLPVITAVDVTAELIKRKFKSASVYCVPSALEKLSVVPDSDQPEAVIIGDMADAWTYELLNEMFDKINNGAQLIAMQKNKFGKTSGGLYLDAGSFIAALEYATGIEGQLVGKPARSYFDHALAKATENRAEVSSDGFIMIGDDLTVDIGGAQKCGGIAILMTTGKTSRSYLKSHNAIQPEYIADNLSEVFPILRNN